MSDELAQEAQRKAGKARTGLIEVTEADLEDGTIGACIACGEQQGGCEPDAKKYECESCGEKAVYGLEHLMLMGRIKLICKE